MNERSKRTNWILDLVILAGFLLCFFMDLTGLALHQWLGVLLGILLLIHLINHWNWVESVVTRFFGKTSPKARVYVIIDFLLLFGLVMIIETGLVMSTWFNLPITDYDTWAALHLYFSIGTLALTVLKIGLHWRWIVMTAAKIFIRKKPALLPVPVQAGGKVVSRRQFLAVMGMVSLGSTLAVFNVLPRAVSAQSENAGTEGSVSVLQNPVTDTGSPTATQTQTASTQEQSTIPQPTSTQVPTVQPTATTPVQVAQSSTICTTTPCRKGKQCAFPGKCRDYMDQDNNGMCDHGECI